MSNIFKRLLAVLGGLIAGLAVVLLADSLTMLLHRPPSNFDPNDADQVKQHMASAPIFAQIALVVGWGLSSATAAFVGRRLATNREFMPGFMAWLLIALATVSNLLLIAHPVWMNVVGLLAILIFGSIGLLGAAPRSEA